MLKIIKFFCFLLFITLISVNASAQSELDKANIKLGLKILQTQIAEDEGNFVISATSVYTIAAMLAVGAEGLAQEELRQNILAPDGIYDSNITEANKLNNTSRVVEINNSIWGDDFNKNYVSILKNVLQTDVFPLPRTTGKINQWIKKKTNGRISSLMTDKETEFGDLYLVNTVYFKDKWRFPFKKKNTKEMPFYSLNQSAPDHVMMMFQQEIADYYEDDKMQALRLTYLNGDSIQFFLPRKSVDFVSFLKNLTVKDLQPEYDSSAEVKIYLPKFEVNYQIDDMRKIFEKLGIHRIFQKYDEPLKHISPIPHNVRQIVHQANIKLDEEGTVAAAATATELQELGMEIFEQIKEREFKADRPFLFMINNGLFIGLYTKPDEMFAERFSDDETTPSQEGFFSRLIKKLFGRRNADDEDDDTEWKSIYYED